MILCVFVFSSTTAWDLIRGNVGISFEVCTGDLLTCFSVTPGSGIEMVGTGLGLKDAEGDAAGGEIGDWFSNRGLRGLRGMPGSGNLLSGDEVLSGDRESPRTGLDVDILCAF